MSIQRRSFFALRCANPDHAQTPPISTISLSGGNAFTIECVFYTEHNNDEDIFIKQNNVFSMGMTNGTVYFNSINLGRIQTVAAKNPIEENDWTNMTVVYDGSKLFLYLQGFLAVEKTVGAGVLHIDSNTRYEIGLMEGYLQEAAIYSKALTADEVRKNQFTPQVEVAKTEMLLDFDAFIPLDKGKNNLPIQLIAACNTVNLVYSLLCDKAGCAIPIGESPVNPGGQGLQSYTILAKVFCALKKIEGDTYLFANGVLGQPETIAIGLSDNQTKPFFEIGTQCFAFDGIVKQGEWADVAVTVSGQEVKLYLNGVASGAGRLTAPFIRQASAAITFGNILANNRLERGFRGFVDSVVVFSVALSASRLLGYADIAPYAFDSDLAALWTFNDGEACEVLHNGAVSMSAGAKVDLCENTLLDRAVSPFTFAIPDTQTGLDALQTWEANTAAKAFSLCVKELTGMEPGGCFNAQGQLYGSLSRVFYEENKENDTLGEAETDKDSKPISGKMIASIFHYALAGAAIYALVYALYGLYVTRSNRPSHYLKKFAKWMLEIPLIDEVFFAILDGAAGGLAQYLRENSPPDSGKAKTDKYEISLTSLTFFNSESEPAGALCARPDFMHPPVVPEWVHDATSQAPALYHKNISTGKTPLLRAVFTVALKTPGSVTIKLGAEVKGTNNFFGSLAEKSITVTANSCHTVDFPLAKNTIRSTALGKHEISWNWYHKSTSRHVLKTTNHQIHIIHDKPLSPWTTAKDSTCLPVYSLLRHCADIAALTETETEANKRFANQLVGWTYAGTRFTARGLNDSAHYARWDQYHRKLTVDLVKFTAELSKTAPVPVTFMDIACLQLLLTRLEGLPDLYLFEIQSLFSDNIRTRTAKGLKDIALPSAFVSAYYTCGMRDATTKNATVWDAFLKLKAPDNTDFTAKGVPFSEYPCTEDLIGPPDKTRYRTLLCSEGTSCEIVMFAQQLFVGALLPQSIVPSLNKSHLFTNSKRNDFGFFVKTGLPLPPSIVRCHSISYNYIQAAIVALINSRIDNKISSAECVAGLGHLIHAVTAHSQMPPPNGSVEQCQARNAWLALLGTPNAPTLSSAFEYNSSIPEIAELAEDLLVALNNNLINLHEGKSDWNSSLQEKYDCIRWEYVYIGSGGEYYFGSNSEDPLLDAPAGGTPELQGEGFYLIDTGDCGRLITLLMLQTGVWKHALPAFKTGYLVNTELPKITATDTRRAVIYSSHNQWNLDEHKIVQNPYYKVPIYILHNEGWVRIY
ncbi:MAG: LamG domain-containing protein [Hydrogenoanaerobacterium sp.]